MKKQKYIIALFAILLIPVLFSTVIALSEIPANEKAIENSNSNVIEASDSNIFMKHIYILHYAKPENQGKPAKPSGAACYKTFSKWTTTPVNYVISIANTDGLNASEMVNAIYSSASTWDASTSANLFNTESITPNTLPWGAKDGKNSLMFGPYSNNGVIAVTSIYYTNGKFSQIQDSDILFNTYYAWSTTGNPSAMDLQNIATHEIGHLIGLSDIYQTRCVDVTMFGYSDYGETNKRTLESADITGLQKLYG